MRRREWLGCLLLAVTIAGLIAWRVGNLGAFSLSNDEGAYLMWAWLVNSGHTLYTETVSVSAPLFIELLSLAFTLGGVSVVTGRALVLVLFALGMVGLAWLSLSLAGEPTSDASRDDISPWLAAFTAVLTFGVAPLAFRLSRSAMGEIPATSLAILSVALACVGRQRGGWRWAALSGLAFSSSVLVKALNPLVVLPVLWLLWTGRRHGRLVALLAFGVAALLPVAACLLVYDPAAMYDQAVKFRFELRQAFPWQPADNLMWVRYFATQQGGIVALAAAGVLLSLLAGGRRRRLPAAVPVALLWLAGALLTVLTHSPLFPHHTIVLLPPLVLLAGQGLASALGLARQRRWVWVGVELLAVVAFLASLPAAVRLNREVLAAGFGREAEAIDVLRQVTRPGEQIVADNLLLAFEAQRQTPPDLGDIAQVAIDSGRQSGDRLKTISQANPVAAVANWAMRLPYMPDYKDWVEANYVVHRRWDDFHILYFGRRPGPGELPDEAVARFEGGIELVGYRARPRAGELWVDLYWRAQAPPPLDFTVFVHLYDGGGALVGSHDGPPFFGYLPSSGWPAGEVMPDRHDFALPADLAPGPYTLAVGMYDPATGERLPLGDGSGDMAVLQTLALP